MIVNSMQDGWEIVYQRSHALLAATLVSHWHQAIRPERWTETLVAIAQHDDQENYGEGSRHLSDIGAPLDFTQVDIDTNRIAARFIIENGARQSSWIALMLSRHSSFLHEGMRGQDNALDQFLDEQIANQKRWMKMLDISKKAADQAYALVGWGDRLSLILCKRELPDGERALDIRSGPDGVMYRVMQREDETIKLDPWPYEVDRVTFSVETRKVKQLKFTRENEFWQALQAAKIENRQWEFVK
ncbi:MAG: DUF3891 family protein [Chitinophagaceae bacterium]|nr:DUF3891 family protein [Anaerolineae bacterium]